jgi:hypothetical protein
MRADVIRRHQIRDTLSLDNQSFPFRFPIEAAITTGATYEFISKNLSQRLVIPRRQKSSVPISCDDFRYSNGLIAVG